MKWNGMGRGLKATAISLALGLGMTACSRDYTVAYLYVTAATKTTNGAISAYAVDYQAGTLQQLPDSPLPSGGSNPVTLVASPNAKYIYVVNRDTSTVVQFDIGTDGKLYPQAPTTSVVQGANGIIGTFPTAAAIDPKGAFLYVTFSYQSGFTTARPGPGGIAVFPINSTNGNLGAPVINTTVGTTAANPLPYIPVGNNPSAIVVSPKGGFVYVVDQEKPTSGSPSGVLLAFTASTSTGALTPISGTVSGGFAAGVQPGGIAEDPSGRFLYVSDSLTNQLFGYTVTNGGTPAAMVTSPFTTGQYPLGVTIDPRGSFLYVANYGSSTIGAFAIDTTTGSLSGTAGGSQAGPQPTCVTIEPALGIYLYSSNNTDNTVSGAQLDPHTGALKQVQGTPYASQPLPTCAVAVANGVHATQLVY